MKKIISHLLPLFIFFLATAMPALAQAPVPGAGGSGRTVQVEDGLAGYIIAVGYFINFAILPLLFGIALLVFVFNLVRYLIIDSSNTDSRDKAKKNAIYGIAAFVFLVSIWGIVNLFVNGLGFDTEESLCPDYLGAWCKDARTTGSFPAPTPAAPATGFDRRVDGTSDALLDFGCGSGVSRDDCDRVNNPDAPLANLLFGAQKDTAELNFRSGPPRATTNTVNVPENLSCADGLNLLQQAADIESSQAAYAFYTKDGGGTAWTNLTDGNSATGIVYDADTINTIAGSGATNIQIVHTHPRSRTEAAGLNMDGHGPSAADYDLLCDSIVSDFPLITVDWTGVWKTTHNAALACPRRTDATDNLRLIDGIFATSMIVLGDRNDEYRRLLQSDILGSRFTSLFTPLATTDFNRLRENEVRGLVGTELAAGQLNTVRTTANAVCN